VTTQRERLVYQVADTDERLLPGQQQEVLDAYLGRSLQRAIYQSCVLGKISQNCPCHLVAHRTCHANLRRPLRPLRPRTLQLASGADLHL
jgi:hypothetical protein